jgi:Xaa-Pro aminopeptidase
MVQRQIGGLIAYYGGQHNMLRPDPIMLLTDLRVLGPSAILIPAQGAPVLLVTPKWDEARARDAHGCANVHVLDEADLPLAMATAAGTLPTPLAMIGTEVMPVSVARAFFDAVGREPLDGGDILRSVSKRRLPFEQTRVRKASEIADAGFAHLCEIARIGMFEYELAAEIEGMMQSLGSEDNFGLIATGPHNVAVRAVSNRRLEAGDTIIGEITPCYKGYFAQLCRTFILGTPSDVQRAKFNILIDAEEAGLAVAQAGRPANGVAKAINEVIAAAGYGDYCRPPYMRTRGHGLGFGGVAPADLTESSALTLEPDMTLVVHPNQYIPETGYLMLGDTVRITEQGAEKFTLTPQRLFWRKS